MMALSCRARVGGGLCGLLGLVAAASCAGTPDLPPLSQAPPAHVEPLLATGAFLNAVSLVETGAGAAVGEFGAILVTRDAGTTWTAVDGKTNQSLKGVAFADSATGIAAGAGGTVLRTEDGGQSWTAVDGGTNVELRAMAFASPSIALIVGVNGTVLRSEDAGRSWRTVASGTTATLRAVRFVSPPLAVAVGDDGVVLQSTDAGATWRARESGTSAALRGVQFSDATTGVAVGGDDRRWRAARVVLRTKDGGASWAKVDAPSGARLYAVAHTGHGQFVAVGEAGAAIRATAGGTTWTAAGASVAGSGVTYAAPIDISNWFVSVASAGSAMVGVTLGGRIYRSTDTAKTWTQVPMPAVTANIVAIAPTGPGAFVVAGGDVILRSAGGAPLERAQAAGGRGAVLSLHFATPLVGIAVGVRGAVQRTVDGGKTWTAVKSGTKRNLRGVALADEKVGIAVAGPAGTGAGMIRTDNGGLTWHEQPCVPGTPICTSVSPLLAVALLPSQFGMAVGGKQILGGGAVVIRTTDGGRSWTQLNPGFTPGQLQALALLDERTALAVGSPGVILRTRDGGTTWTRRDSGTRLNLQGVAFADASRGLIVGQAGTVLVTSDGGVTWQREPPRTTRDLGAVRFQDANTAIITGASGVVLRHTWTTTASPPASGAGPRRLP